VTLLCSSEARHLFPVFEERIRELKSDVRRHWLGLFRQHGGYDCGSLEKTGEGGSVDTGTVADAYLNEY